MRKRTPPVRPLAAICAALAIAAMAITADSGAAPWEKSSRLDRVVKAHNPEKLVTVSGVVKKIYVKHPSTAANRNSVGWHMVVQNDTEKVDVHLVPRWYLDSLDGVIHEGDQVEVFGTRQKAKEKQKKKGITFRLWAAKVSKGGAVVLDLRDETGKPVWSNH